MPDIHLHKEDLSAAFPALLTASAYGLVLFGLGDALGFTGREMKILLQVEFLVIHSFPFLCIFALMGRKEAARKGPRPKGESRTYWRLGFWLFLGMYVLVALSMGWTGPIHFFVATAATYPLFLGFWMKGPAPSPDPGAPQDPLRGLFPSLGSREREALLGLISRWVFYFILYLSWISLFDLSNNVDEWRAEASTYKSGLWYFLSMGLLELWGVHGKTMAWMNRVLKKGLPPSAQPGPQ